MDALQGGAGSGQALYGQARESYELSPGRAAAGCGPSVALDSPSAAQAVGPSRPCLLPLAHRR